MTELLRRRWPALLVTAWAILLLGLGFAAYGGDVTVREQRDVATARGAVDQATVELVRAAGQDAAVRVGAYRFASRCEVSLVRDGAEYLRRIQLHPRASGEARLLKSIARRLPDRYRATVHDGELTADADEFVEVRGTATDQTVSIEVRTGCRPSDDPVVTLRTPPTEAERAGVSEVLRLVGVGEEQPTWRTETVPCGDGAVRTVVLTVAGIPARPLGDVAGLAPPDAQVLVGEEHRLAYRRGGVSVIAETHDTALHITRTTASC